MHLMAAPLDEHDESQHCLPKNGGHSCARELEQLRAENKRLHQHLVEALRQLQAATLSIGRAELELARAFDKPE